MLVIDPDECIDCGACEAECPVEAISTPDRLPLEEAAFEEINAAIRVGVEAVEAALTQHLISTG